MIGDQTNNRHENIRVVGLLLGIILTMPTSFLAPAKRVSYPAIDSFTFSLFNTESGLDSSDTTLAVVLKVLLCASRLKDVEEKNRVKMTCTTKSVTNEAVIKNRPS